MPLRIVRYIPPEAPRRLVVMGPPPSAVGYRGSNEFLRAPSNWYSIMERSYQEAVEKLKSVLKTDLKIDPTPIDATVPCLVDLEEGRTEVEKARIRRAHRKMANIFAGFFDRMVRYSPESRSYAWDWLTQSVKDSKILWGSFECLRFRAPAAETEPSKKRRKKGAPDS